MVVFLFETLNNIFLLLCLCILIICLYIFIVPFGKLRLTCLRFSMLLFISCTANARVKPGDGTQHAPFQNVCVVLCIVSFVSFCALFVCKCVLYYCHRVATHLQLTNISHYIISEPDPVISNEKQES